ncbi:hypothetical protein [Pusillimonas sp. ANT_WB101]|uniref:hypothetical protein n=1 Tax=Pusillimonas sp. ANT_WB101 TaxID=2597356 RepID=UPI00210244CE|nr:hypothetical protein [Pusillimonas sp. ANT_WB101]
MKRLADFMIVAFDGRKVRLHNVASVTKQQLETLQPYLNEKEVRHLQAAKKQGYSVTQQFVFAVTADNTYRASQLLDMLETTLKSDSEEGG